MRAYERFIKYAVIDTQSCEGAQSVPSTAKQFKLAELLKKELEALGLERVQMTDNAYVYAFLPASEGMENEPTIGLIAHLDTATDFSGSDVRPLIHEGYNGRDINLGFSGLVLSASQFPDLKACLGHKLITTDGTTLLGADDKAGIAEIVTACERIINEKLPHCALALCFTPDEEIGHGAELLDLKRFGADFAYTVDGGDVGSIEYENFNGAAATVEVKGFSVHPGSSLDKMINASNVAMEFHMALPSMDRPEHTDGYQGFFHLTDMRGDVSGARLDYIIRDHDWERLCQRKNTMELIASRLNARYGEGTVTLRIRDQYRNMIEKIRPHMHLVETAETAVRMTGLEPEVVPIRGGTDGAVLSWKGLPCPNLGTGGFNFHGTAECITAERMDRAVEILLNIVALYTR